MSSAASTLIGLIGSAEFLSGLVFGAVAFVLIRLLRATVGWALGLSAAALIGLYITYAQDLGLLVSLLLLALGGYALERAVDSAHYLLTAVGFLLVAAGSLLVNHNMGLPDIAWMNVMSPLVIAGGGYALLNWRHSAQRHLLGPLFAVTAFGIWATVPDTEVARVLLGSALALAAVTTNRIGPAVSGAGAFTLVGLTVWVAGTGGAARPGSVIGAWACFGLLFIVPLLRETAKDLTPGALVVGHVVFVVLSSRVFGLWEEALPAALATIALSLFALGALLWWAWAPSRTY